MVLLYSKKQESKYGITKKNGKANTLYDKRFKLTKHSNARILVVSEVQTRIYNYNFEYLKI